MLKTVIKLFNSKSNLKLGNHSVEFTNIGRDFKYHNNTIIKVDDDNKLFITDYCGYKNYRSTTRAINDYEYLLYSKGYEQLGIYEDNDEIDFD